MNRKSFPAFITFFFFAAAFSTAAHAFPENVRHGYASCSSCHVSPTGGGVLTEYGRKASEDFLTTWGREGENGFLWNAVQLPSNVAAGANVRHISYKRDLDGVRTEKRFIMQVEGEVAVKLGSKVWVDFSRGGYNKFEQTQRAYVLVAPNDNLFIRAGKFFVPYGIYEADHTTITRRELGFDQGMETINAEIGLQSEAGEIIGDVILGDSKTGDASIDPRSKDRGVMIRAASYYGGKSQFGFNLLSTTGDFVDRNAFGAFAITGLGERFLYLGEVDFEQKKLVSSLSGRKQNSALLSHQRVSFEATRGLHVSANWDSLLPLKSDLHTRQWSAGPGIQWFPRPHFEFSVQAAKIYQGAYSDPRGYDLKMMSHLWL